MNDWAKVLVPIIMTAMGAVIFGLFADVKRINETQMEGQLYIYRIQQLELRVEELEDGSK